MATGRNFQMPGCPQPTVKTPPVVPPVYHPKPSSAVLQAKFPRTNQPSSPAKQLPIAPAVFRPSSAAQVMQKKIGGVQPARATAPANGRGVIRATEQRQPTRTAEWRQTFRQTVLQRAAVSSTAFGFAEGDVATAARVQLTPDTCWAAAIAIAAKLLAKTNYANEITVFGLGKNMGLTLPSGRLKGAECFKLLSSSMTGITMAAYEADSALAKIPGWLGEKKVILLCSAQHVIVLAGMKVGANPNDPAAYEFDMIDPATEGRKWVGFDVLKAFKDAVVLVQ
jgi:hypothetical protein